MASSTVRHLAAALTLLTSARAMCWYGIAGANMEASCEKSQVYKDNKYESPNCYSRTMGKQCVENNDGGMGDGCDGNSDQSACESYQKGDGEKRDPEKSFDGTDKHCRWLPEITKDQKPEKCQVDDGCKWYPDRGDCSTGTCEGNCENSDSANTKSAAWEKQRGRDCEQRMKFGCYENNNGMGEDERCKKHKEETACLGQVDDCSEGTCSGTATDGGSKACSERSSSEGECKPGGADNGCTWTKQCCQWIATPTDPEDTCLNSGKGTLDGVCAYNDGSGPPSKEIVAAGFEYGLFKNTAEFNGKCALIASMRSGKGSATALGSNEPDMLGSNCKNVKGWNGLAEHIGHTSDTIDEYCTNFIPDSSAMAALVKYSPDFIITKAEQGQFGAVFPGLQNQMFIVTGKPEYGKCLFTADQDKWGAGVCTCDKKECNGASALGLIVDPNLGPMRLLQFIDGSLSPLKDKVNGVVTGLLDANGKIDPANVGKVTEADVIEIMKLDGVSSKTTKDELWGIVQDFQKVAKSETDYKATVMEDATYKALKVDKDKVKAANDAAGCQLYGDDGVPNPVCLGNLSEDQVKAVATATGHSATSLEAGGKKAKADDGSGSGTSSKEGTAGGVNEIAVLHVMVLLLSLCSNFLYF